MLIVEKISILMYKDAEVGYRSKYYGWFNRCVKSGFRYFRGLTSSYL